ncbi:MAG: cytochrome [Bdellovibrionaceae bacterium]|jgi:hypothetical protein|nr:cytochrome [Pseudobdellovibrionaceae bacterium]
MYIQGDLQLVFDALYNLGVIDPVLDMDWSEAMNELPEYHDSLHLAVETVNKSGLDVNTLTKSLGQFDDQTLSYLAMEVAREFADFHSRQEVH